VASACSASLATAFLAWVLCGAALAQGEVKAQPKSAALAGMLGSKALLVVEGAEPKLVGPGETWRGVRVVSTQGNTAVLDIDGQRHSVRVGEAPVSVGMPQAPGSGQRVVLSASSGGHFVTQGLMNSRPTQFLIDTGATTIGIGAAEADRMGLKYKDGEPVQVATANGVASGWKVKISSVRLNDVEVRDVDAVVTPLALPFVLLGNSFLTRFHMTRTNERLVLEKRF